jgi:hypothetical protein
LIHVFLAKINCTRGPTGMGRSDEVFVRFSIMRVILDLSEMYPIG